ncbi:MAG: four helix bundle protein [Fidelibacterota bacterium]
MSKVEKFEDLDVWQESVRLSIDLYRTLNNSKDYALRNQIQRSSVSIASNIAEGFERNSNKEFMQFLHIAKGSCSELRTQLYIGMKTGLFDDKHGVEFIEKSRKISSMLYKLIKVRKNEFGGH